MRFTWDSNRFVGNTYAVNQYGATFARICERNGKFDVLPAPDAPKAWHDERSGVLYEGFPTLEDAKHWIRAFARRHPCAS